jgi:prepilin-type N-terminal cleavage/methylation domain-containing protein
MFPERSNNNQKGYTLLEVLVSVLFFSVIALGLSYSFTNSMFLTSQDKDVIRAQNLARMYLSEVQSSWTQQVDYDGGVLPTVDSTYTDNGRYVVNATSTDMAQNDQGIVIVRQVKIIYENQSGFPMVDLYLDVDRP